MFLKPSAITEAGGYRGNRYLIMSSWDQQASRSHSGQLRITTTVCICLHFNGHFPGGPGLAGTRISKQVDLYVAHFK